MWTTTGAMEQQSHIYAHTHIGGHNHAQTHSYPYASVCMLRACVHFLSLPVHRARYVVGAVEDL